MKTKRKEEVKVSYDPDFCCKEAEEAFGSGFFQFVQGHLSGSAGFYLMNKMGKLRIMKYCPFCGDKVEAIEGKAETPAI